MRIAIFGSSGFIGRPLAEYLRNQGHIIRRFVRIHVSYLDDPEQVPWSPATNTLMERDLEDCDAVINLCGSSVVRTIWTKEAKRRITDSRVRTTDLICRKLAGMGKPPPLLLNASAIGYYGVRPKEDRLDETSPAGTGFLASMCQSWEEATGIAEWAGIRVIHLRTGIVLGSSGGIIKQMLTPFRLGLGARMGYGTHCMSWITLNDFLSAVNHLLGSPQITKAVNLTAPNPVTNAEYTQSLADVLGRRARISIPAEALQLLFGEFAREALLGGQCALPTKLLNSGFQFKDEYLKPALQSILNPVT